MTGDPSNKAESECQIFYKALEMTFNQITDNNLNLAHLYNGHWCACIECIENYHYMKSIFMNNLCHQQGQPSLNQYYFETMHSNKAFVNLNVDVKTKIEEKSTHNKRDDFDLNQTLTSYPCDVIHKLVVVNSSVDSLDQAIPEIQNYDAILLEFDINRIQCGLSNKIKKAKLTNSNMDQLRKEAVSITFEILKYIDLSKSIFLYEQFTEFILLFQTIDLNSFKDIFPSKNIFYS